MNILCVIPARGGSKGLRNKNIKPLLGKPLIAYTIEAALKSKLSNKVVVSTDDPKIAHVVKKYHIQVINRPKKYATDTSPIEIALRYSVDYLKAKENYAADIIVWLQANIPVRKTGQIDNVVKKLILSNADSAVTVSAVEQFPQWMKKMDKCNFLHPLFNNSKQYRRQDIKPLYRLDGAVVAVKAKILMGTKNLRGVHVFLGKRIIGVIQEKKYSIEIDSKEDFDLVKHTFKKIN